MVARASVYVYDLLQYPIKRVGPTLLIQCIIPRKKTSKEKKASVRSESLTGSTSPLFSSIHDIYHAAVMTSQKNVWKLPHSCPTVHSRYSGFVSETIKSITVPNSRYSIASALVPSLTGVTPPAERRWPSHPLASRPCVLVVLLHAAS